MLVIRRLKGESFMIGDDIEVFITGIRGGTQVLVGITAPKEVSIHRREIYDAIQREKKADK